MEEKRPGQPVEQDRNPPADAQNSGGRPAAEAHGDDRALVEQARKHAAPSNQAMKDAGFGDDKGGKVL
jgi:hypothetical protein